MPDPPRGHRLDCGCGFAVQGDEREVVEIAQRHALTVHGIELADGIVRALAQPLPDGSHPHTSKRQRPRRSKG